MKTVKTRKMVRDRLDQAGEELPSLLSQLHALGEMEKQLLEREPYKRRPAADRDVTYIPPRKK